MLNMLNRPCRTVSQPPYVRRSGTRIGNLIPRAFPLLEVGREGKALKTRLRRRAHDISAVCGTREIWPFQLQIVCHRKFCFCKLFFWFLFSMLIHFLVHFLVLNWDPSCDELKAADTGWLFSVAFYGNFTSALKILTVPVFLCLDKSSFY